MAAGMAFSQESTPEVGPEIRSRKGEKYLPTGKEWGLGVSADPFLRYLGNSMNASALNNGPRFDFTPNLTSNVAFFGKYMKDAKTAYRIRFNVGIKNSDSKAVVFQDDLNSDPSYPAFTEDWQKVTTTGIVIAPGIEKRRGSTRLQGIYGAELVLGFNNTHVSYDYGNPISADFDHPTTTSFVNAGYGANIVQGGAGVPFVRVTDDKFGSTILAGARGFVGVEYFFAPKISLGGEFGYMLGFQTQGRGVTTTEVWDPTTLSTREVKYDKYRNGGITALSIGLDNLNGAISLLFYF